MFLAILFSLKTQLWDTKNDPMLFECPDIASRELKRRIFRSPLLSKGMLFVIVLMLSSCGGNQKIYDEAVKPDAGQKRLADWYVLMRENRELPELQKLTLVNDFFNQVEFVDDMTHWGKEDYWATPQEMLLSGGGDCEDFATAKYFTLRQLNVPHEKLRLIYVKSLRLNQPHMVLGYYAEPSADPLVLDNLMKIILFASERSDLLPVYSFNDRSLWVIREQGSELVGKAERLSLWRELQTRFVDEVFTPPPTKTVTNTLIRTEYTH